MMDARTVAYNLILDWDVDLIYPNLALKKALHKIESEREKRFITALVYGVIERKITLDHFINQCADRPIAKADPQIRAALRMGTYQMLYMNVPSSAACNTSVEIIKNAGLHHKSGFVNAVLRRIAREKDQLLLLKKADYSVRFSIEPFLVDLLLDQYGKDGFLNIIDGILQPSNSIFLFHNFKVVSEETFLAQLSSEGIELIKTDIAHLFKSEKGFSIEDSAAYNQGWFHILGYHSALAASFVREKDETLIDLCAAPGGKTFVISALSNGKVSAFDIHPHKVELLKKSALRLRRNNVTFDCQDASVYHSEWENTADFVLCDVPCSGLGIMGKKPDIKYKKYNSIEFTDLQFAILQNGSKYLKSGGRLVYSTCTIDQRENEQQISKFLSQNGDFSLDNDTLANGMQTFLPQNGEDGFFIAVLRKA